MTLVLPMRAVRLILTALYHYALSIRMERERANVYNVISLINRSYINAPNQDRDETGKGRGEPDQPQDR